MADGVIEIIIGGADGGGGSAGGSGALPNKEKKPENMIAKIIDMIRHPLKSAENVGMDYLKSYASAGKVAAAAGAAYLVKDVAQGLWQYGNMELNRHFSLKENYLAQNKMTAFNSSMSALKGIASTIGSSTAAGAAIGFQAGPVGAALGAVVGMAYGSIKSVATIQIQKAEHMERHNMQLNATNAQTQFSASRAALVNGSRGTEY
jgi:hypothetical protein